MVYIDALDEQNAPTNTGLHENVLIQNCTFQKHSFFAIGFSFTQGAVAERCQVTASNVGVLTSLATNVTVRNSLLVDCETALGAFNDPSQLLLSNCVLAYNRVVALTSAGAQFVLRNNILYRNDGVESAAGGASLQGDYNDFFQNVVGESPLGDHDTNLDPGFSDEVTFHLRPDSRVIDRGDPDSTNNDRIPPGLGTVRNDMGAYGGPSAGNVGLVTVP
jgi:hypothetical protein